MEEFVAAPVDVQTSLQASADGQVEQEVGVAVYHRLLRMLSQSRFSEFVTVACFRC